MMTPGSPQTDTGSQQAATKGTSPTCYNCGDSGHYFDACPEPARKIPVGLAAAQAAKANAGQQSHHGGYNGQDHRSKRQKTGSGPVVTRYPVPGPVVTKYGPPATHHQPYGGPQGFNNIPPHQFPQSQYGSQPQQQYVPHSGYPPHGYHQPPMPQAYNQHNHYPITPYAQAYGSIPSQGQGYGYGSPAGGPYYGQPYGPQDAYGQPFPPQFTQQTLAHYPQQPPPMQYQQQNMQQPVGYGPPQQHGLYQPVSYPQGGPQSDPYNGPQQYSQRQTQVQPFQSFQGSHGQGYNGRNIPFPNQQLQHWTEAPGPAQNSPVAGGSSNYSDRSNERTGDHTVRQESGGLPSVKPTDCPPINDDRPQFSQSSQDHSIQEQLASTANGASNGQLNLDNDAQVDEFDIAWEESVFKHLLPVSVIAILTPLSQKLEEEPLVSTVGDAPIKSKYVRVNNLEVFTLPIQKSLHWATLQKDPALAAIDEAYPAVPFNVWDEYREERKKRKLLEACAYDTTHLEEPWYETVQEDVNDQIRKEYADQHLTPRSARHRESSRTSRRSIDSQDRSGTPGSHQEAPIIEAEVARRAPSHGEAQVKRTASPGPPDTLLAPVGVTSGSPVPTNSSKHLLSGSSSTYNEGHKEPIQHSNPRRQMRQDSGYASARPSIDRRSSWNNGLAFPPPKSTRLHSGYDGCVDSPISEGSMRSHNSRLDNDKRGSKSISPLESPLSPTSAALLGEVPATNPEDRYLRKEPLRQSEDRFVKKRPQPKVADAYSRRW